MTTLKILNPENATAEETAKFKVREAARAIVYDRDGKIGLLHVSHQNYHKLPGGGVEAGEGIVEALERECLEELGCKILIRGEVGQIIEYRKIFNLLQTSYVYLASVVGEKGLPSFTSEEIADGFLIQWLDIEEAIKLLSSDQALNDEGRLYIVPRDLTLLKAAISLK